MTAWEYRILPANGGMALLDVAKTLEAWGKDGWELVCGIPLNWSTPPTLISEKGGKAYVGSVTLLFKRPLASPVSG